ncbi:hypothetical protein KLP28_12920 [Nocardioidaceae bacterium]|nr:hypothetical protein KLP28_12920 [Nocardioidaceae bacterium]
MTDQVTRPRSTCVTTAAPTPSSPASGEWITREDLATLARRSVDTIRRDVERHSLDTRTDEKGRVLVNANDFLALGRLAPEDLRRGATPAESVAMTRARDEVGSLTAELARLEGRLEHLGRSEETLRDQLAVKDKQIAKLDETVKQLTALLTQLARSPR